jgi:ferrous iron transport protein B
MADSLEDIKFEGTIDEETLKTTAGQKGSVINVALVGNPNSGKTTLYNFASGKHERVGNYGGVTVDAREARFSQNGYTFNIVDLPGTYSITE